MIIARLYGQGLSDGRNILRFFKRLDQGRFIQGLGFFDALSYEINIRVTQGSEIGGRFLLVLFDVRIPEMFAYRAYFFDGRRPHAVQSNGLCQGGFTEGSRPSRGGPYEDRGNESDLFGLLHDGQGIGVIPGPEEDIRLGFFRMPEHGAIVSASQGRALEGFSLKRSGFPSGVSQSLNWA